MKANEALNLLRISRKTLHVYASAGKIRFTVMPNGFYDYNDEDIYKLLNRDVKRKTVIYARISTIKQKNDLNNQIEQLKQWCFMNGYTINAIYSDIASGISFDKRKGFFDMLDEIISSNISSESNFWFPTSDITTISVPNFSKRFLNKSKPILLNLSLYVIITFSTL